MSFDIEMSLPPPAEVTREVLSGAIVMHPIESSSWNGKNLIGSIAAGLCIAAGVIGGPTVSAGERDTPYPPRASLAEVRERIDAAPRGHPRLLIDNEGLGTLRASLIQDPFRRAIAGEVVRQADALLSVTPIERTLQGRRLLGQSRRCLARTIVLSMAFHMTDDTKYVRRCEREMVAVSRFRDWNPSHFLDVAEMTAALAIGYDWLYEQLSDSGRGEIREAIIRKGVVLPFETRHRGWVKSRNKGGKSATADSPPGRSRCSSTNSISRRIPCTTRSKT